MMKLLGKPLISEPMVDMSGVEKCDQNIHVEQSSHHDPSESRRRSISAFVTGKPRDANGRKPVFAGCATWEETSPVRALRNKRDTTWPADTRSLCAISRVAAKRSSSISSVVRMRLL